MLRHYLDAGILSGCWNSIWMLEYYLSLKAVVPVLCEWSNAIWLLEYYLSPRLWYMCHVNAWMLSDCWNTCNHWMRKLSANMTRQFNFPFTLHMIPICQEYTPDRYAQVNLLWWQSLGPCSKPSFQSLFSMSCYMYARVSFTCFECSLQALVVSPVFRVSVQQFSIYICSFLMTIELYQDISWNKKKHTCLFQMPPHNIQALSRYQLKEKLLLPQSQMPLQYIDFIRALIEGNHNSLSIIFCKSLQQWEILISCPLIIPLISYRQSIH